MRELKLFFQKACRWRSEKFEEDLLQKIEKEDVELNKELCGERMRISNGMDKIWERYDQDFFNQPQNRIHCLDKAVLKNGPKKQDTYILSYGFHQANLFLINIINKEERQKNSSRLVKKMKHNTLKIPHYFIA